MKCLMMIVMALWVAVPGLAAGSEAVPPEAASTTPVANPPRTSLDYLKQAGIEVVQPAVFVGKTALRAPQFLRPVRGLWRTLTLPFFMFSPVETVLDLPSIPADLVAPFGATYGIIKDTPKLAGPLQAVWSLTRAATAACGAD